MKKETAEQINARLKSIIDSGKYELKWFDVSSTLKRPAKALYHRGYCIGVILKHPGPDQDIYEVVPYIPITQMTVPPIMNYRCPKPEFAMDIMQKFAVDFFEHVQAPLIQMP